MKKKKGFIFVETIVVIVVLLTSLLYLYNSFIALNTTEKKRLLYDDVSYLYKTYYLRKYFTSQRLDRMIENLSKDYSSSNTNFLISFGCSSMDVFDNYAKEGTFCEILSQRLHIANLYVTYYDLSVLQECDNNIAGLCNTFSRVNNDLGDYLRTLGGKGQPGYRLIVEFMEDGKGNFCSDDPKCLRYYATIKVGDL